MSVQIYRRIDTIPRERVKAGIYYALSGKTARIEIWEVGDRGRRLDTRRCSQAHAEQRANELLDFWAQSPDQPTGDV